MMKWCLTPSVWMLLAILPLKVGGQDTSKAMPIAQSWLQVPFNSTVYLYNSMKTDSPGHELLINVDSDQNTNDLPKANKTITAVGPNNIFSSGIMEITTFPRYGIKRNSVHECTETVFLPHVKEPIQLKQRVIGTGFGTKISIGAQFPGKQTEWFSDYQWRQNILPHFDEQSGDMVGEYIISYCFYHFSQPKNISPISEIILAGIRSVTSAMTTAISGICFCGVAIQKDYHQRIANQFVAKAEKFNGEVKEPFKSLGLSVGASSEDIEKAHKKMSLVTHPDKHQQDPLATKKFQTMQNHYATIKPLSAQDKLDVYNTKGMDGLLEATKFDQKIREAKAYEKFAEDCLHDLPRCQKKFAFEQKMRLLVAAIMATMAYIIAPIAHPNVIYVIDYQKIVSGTA